MLLSSVEIETAPAPTHSVIWLHGLGADGHDFEPIVPQLVDRTWPPLRFVFPHAPTRPVTVNGGMRMRAWYDITGPSLAQRQDEAGIRASIAQVQALIAREVERGVPARRVVLAGFSQGSAIALATALRQPDRLAGVAGLSGYLPLHELTAPELAPANADLPVFLAHGNADPVVPLALGGFTRDWLRQAGYAVDWHTYPMAHQVCAEEVADLRGWLGARLAQA